MAQLQLDSNLPGHYVNPDWVPGSAGTFAVVIGVSRYKHLDGTPSSYGLGQLNVSALTAYRFFEWLRDNYSMQDCPLSECWLLLSPNDKESQFEPALNQHDALPTMEGCAESIRYWHASMQSLPIGEARKSRAMFFFSGHGLEVYQDKQILLPCDYLRPPYPSTNEALSTNLLMRGMSSLNVPVQFFFLDACRNDNQKLREQDIEGRRIINIQASAYTNSERIAPLFYATCAGSQAWQPQRPSEGISLFGEALINGLNAYSPLRREHDGTRYLVNVYPLQKYVKNRVIELLNHYKSSARQRVLLGGYVDDIAITQLLEWHNPGYVSDDVRYAPAEVERTNSSLTESKTEVFRFIGSATLNERGILDSSLSSVAAGWDDEHRLIVELLEEARFFSLSKLKWLTVKPSTLITTIAIEKDYCDRQYGKVVLSLPSDSVGTWMQLQRGAMQYCCVLPTDSDANSGFIVYFDIQKANSSPASLFNYFETALATSSDPSLSWAIEVWNHYRTSTAAEAIQAIDAYTTENSHTTASKLTAIIVLIVLLRTGRSDLLYEWAPLVKRHSSHCSDCAVLYVAYLLRCCATRNDSFFSRSKELSTESGSSQCSTHCGSLRICCTANSSFPRR